MRDPNLVVINSQLHYQCPDCSRAHRIEDDNGKVLVKVGDACARCTCPLDKDQAQAFSEKMAEESRNPDLAAAGAKLRGEVSRIVSESEGQVANDPQIHQQLKDIMEALQGITDRQAATDDALLKLQIAQEDQAGEAVAVGDSE